MRVVRCPVARPWNDGLIIRWNVFAGHSALDGFDGHDGSDELDGGHDGSDGHDGRVGLMDHRWSVLCLEPAYVDERIVAPHVSHNGVIPPSTMGPCTMGHK